MPTRCTEAGTCSGIRNSWPPAVHMQANRIGRIVRLGPSRRRRQNRRDRQNCQSRNAHQSLLRDMRGAATPFALALHLPFRPGRIFRSPADRSLCSQSIHVRALGQAECCRAGPGDRHTLQEFRLAWPSFRRMPRYYRRLYMYCVEQHRHD